MSKIARIVLGLLAAIGTFAGARLSISHIQSGEVCPELGVLPACYIVFLGYSLILLSTMLKKHIRKAFYTGWLPVFALAAFGVSLELAGQDICPQGALGVPQCFYSLTMIVICLLLFLVFTRSTELTK